MSTTIQEIERAISELSYLDRAKLRDWLIEFDQDEWDKQIAEDAAAGRLDALAEETLNDLRADRCTDL